jgi:endonuclease-3 related protein
MIQALETAGLGDPAELAAADRTEIAALVSHAPGARAPSTVAALRSLADWWNQHESELEQRTLSQLRDELRAIPGIGYVTADAILLQGLGRPVVPIDRGTLRILLRHGWLDASSELEEVSEAAVTLPGGDTPTAQLLARGFATVHSRWCRASKPDCESCPLADLLPEGGPRETGLESAGGESSSWE